MTNIPRTQSSLATTTVRERSHRALSAMTVLLALSITGAVFGGSATWKSNPASSDWYTAANWTPQTVPNNPSDSATFATSNTTKISFPGFLTRVDVESFLFQPAASAFTIDIGLQVLRIDGAGVINSSGVTQTFMSSGGLEFGKFGGNTSAGDNTLYIIEPHDFNHFFNFYNSSTAGHARFVVSENKSFFNSGWLGFNHFSTAANAEFMINGGAEANKAGGVVFFFDHSSAGSANLTANGGTAPGADGGSITFQDRATAADATLIANGGSHGGKAGTIYFDFFARGDRARIELFGSGALQIIYSYARPSLGVGSIEGDGQIFLGGFNLTVGANGLDTTFSGLIGDGSGGRGGSLTKVGNGKLILDHASTYTGGTSVKDGFLVVKNARGSGTGSGPVQVNHGRLVGSGIIAGTVTIGSGSGEGAVLAPKTDPDSPLTTISELRFNSDGTYAFGLNSNNSTADEVVANGVTIKSGAQFTFSDFGTGKLARGTIFTVISNTSNSAINGTFTNLADSLTFTNRANTYKVNYHGDDGNDLTLTVQ